MPIVAVCGMESAFVFWRSVSFFLDEWSICSTKLSEFTNVLRVASMLWFFVEGCRRSFRSLGCSGDVRNLRAQWHSMLVSVQCLQLLAFCCLTANFALIVQNMTTHGPA